MRSMRLVVIVLLVVLDASRLNARPAAEALDRPRLDGSTRGELAFAPGPEGPWQIAHRGTAIPADAWLRTSSGSPCRLQTASGRLHLAPETQVRLVSRENRLVVVSGEAFLQSAAGWTVELGAVRLVCSKGTSVEFEMGADGLITACVETGEIELAGGKLPATKIGARRRVSCRGDVGEVEVMPLAPAELERLHAWTSPGRAEQGLGELLVNDPQSGAPVRLNLARYHVNVVLHPPVALVQIDQSFYNPYPRQQEGTFLFNLPEGASVSRFAMYTSPKELIEGELIERERASGIYQSIVSRQRDPAILEQIGGNLFRMRVFPILANDTKRILLDFTLPLVEEAEGWHTFELPLFSDRKPAWNFALTGTIRGPNVPGTAVSQTHPETQFRSGEQEAVKFEFRRQSYKPESAFVLRFQQRAAEHATARSFVARPQNELNDRRVQTDKIEEQTPCEFLVTLAPDAVELIGEGAASPAPPADVLVLADTSGATADRARLRQLVRTIARSLRAGDRFRLGCVDADFRSLTLEWIIAQSDAAEKALARFDEEFFLGETDLGQSFTTALGSLPAPEPGRRRLAIYVGDGTLTEGHAAPAAVRKTVAAALDKSAVRFSAVLTQSDAAGKQLMQELASDSGGRVFKADAIGRGELFEWALAGCPSPAKIVAATAEGVPAADLFVPTAWLPERGLHILGRRKQAGKLNLDLTLEREGKMESRHWTLDLRNDPAEVFVGRLWGQRKLEQLRAQEPKNRDISASRLIREIVALSQEWTLLCPHTAFLVLEKEEDYESYGIARSRRHQYWEPPDALIAGPLSPEVLAELRIPPRGVSEITAEQFAEALTAAKKALEEDTPHRALRHLTEIEKSPLAGQTPEFKSLQERATKALARAELLRNLGPQRGLFERSGSFGFDGPPADFVWQFLHGYAGVGRADDERQSALARRLAPPAGDLTLEEFAKWVGTASGLEVRIDRATLVEEGVPLDTPVDLRGIRLMSLENMLSHVLVRSQLTHLLEDETIRITTTTRASDMLVTKLYPVIDLIQPGRATDYSLLVDADLDRELLSTRQLQEKLNRRVTVKFDATPAHEVFDLIGKQLDDNLLVDRVTLTEEGVALDAPIDEEFHDVPLRMVLKRVCEPMQLDTVIEREALIVTTSTRACEKLQTRLHSAQGIVYEVPRDWERQRVPNARGLGGAGGAFGVGGGMMGGMGMGAMGGGIGGVPAAVANGPAHTGISESADDRAAESSQPPVRDPAPNGAEAPPIPGNAGFRLQAPKAPEHWKRTTTAPTLMQLIESTVAPDSWENLSGPGSIVYVPSVLGFAVRQTTTVHDEIGELLDRMREFPDVQDERNVYVPVAIRDGEPAEAMQAPFASLNNLLMQVIQPDSWEDLSGPGSISIYRPKMLVAIRQTQEIHREIRNLLTSLRRARFLPRQGRQWKSFDLVSGPWFNAALGLTDLPAGARLSDLPEPDPEELAALAALAEPLELEQTWRSAPAGGGHPRTISLVRTGSRSEFSLEGRAVRVEGDEAAVAYPDLALVERGEWGEAARRIVDARLPWMPHRSRHELARLFRIERLEQGADRVRLRLRLPGAAAGNEIVITVGRRHGLPIEWESRLDGEVVLRLKFADLGDAAGRPIWKTVTALDASGNELERWELVKIAAREGGVLPLNRHDPKCVVFDLRDQEQAETPTIVQALQGLRLRDWGATQRALAEALRDQPGQPLILLLKAWSLAQRDRGSAAVVTLLRQIARQGTGGLLKPLVDHEFPQISDAVIYEILQELPVDRRSVTDWENLACAAARAGHLQAGIESLQAAIRQAGPESDNFERERKLVEFLLEASRTDESLKLARTCAARADVPPERLAALAETFHKGNVSKAAQELMQQALASPSAVRERRQQLLLRRANIESGMVRLRMLLEAIRAAPVDSQLRVTATDLLLSELMDPMRADDAGALALEAGEAKLETTLRLRQAELDVLRGNQIAAAEIGWKLYETMHLPDDRFTWLFERLRAAEQLERFIRLVEDRLRSGKSLDQRELDAAAFAYDELSRPAAALRARTNSRDFKAKPRGSVQQQGPFSSTRGAGMF